MVGKEDVCLSYWVSVTFQGRTVKLQGGKWNSPLFCLRLGRFLRFSWILKLPSQQIPISSGIFWNGNRVANRLKQAANTGENRFSTSWWTSFRIHHNITPISFFGISYGFFLAFFIRDVFFQPKKINQTPAPKTIGGISHQPKTPDVGGSSVVEFPPDPNFVLRSSKKRSGFLRFAWLVWWETPSWVFHKRS